MTGQEFSACRANYEQMLLIMDGEYYIQSIPTYDMMTQMRSWACGSANGFPGMEIDCFVYHLKDKQYRRYAASPYSRLLSRDEYRAPMETHCGWRPMLIPLDRYGQLSRCLKKIKNGTIVRGGTLSYGETFCGRHQADFSDGVSGCAVLSTVFADIDIEIADSSDDPDRNISWIVWDGKLVCSRVLIGDARLDTLYSKNGCFVPSLRMEHDIKAIDM